MPRALLVVLLLLGAEVRAQVLPPPRVVPPQNRPPQVVLPPAGMPGRSFVPPVMPPAGKPLPTLPLAASPYPVPGYQPSAYQVWQNYGVNRNGWIVPRIWQATGGGYWLYNGAPFPYVYTMPGQHFPAAAPTGAP